MDEEYVVFSDIRPAAQHHVLIVTKEHIPDAKRVTSEQKSIVERLVELGKQVLLDQGADLSDTRFGFHWPPFHSVSHLHMHAISPASSMGLVQRIIFRENSWWFVSPEYVLSRL
ncbi:hypothetical protein B566_EDAN001477 [Ephemera danica]|nr:hypothetical protein B566_EDAN001477 [Ephemera danica]